MNYLITFTGHTDSLTRDGLLPETVKDLIYVASESEDGVVRAANDRLGHYVRLNGMVVSVDPSSFQSIFTERRFISLDRLTAIDMKVQVAPEQTPGINAPELGWSN